MFGLLAGILFRASLPGHVARRGYASEWECLRPESEARGLALLKEWLPPAQLNAYETSRYFEVVGCDTGTIYRIYHGFQGNIEQLDSSSGQPVCRWCFAPDDLVAAGDAMLAQKIALETHESDAGGKSIDNYSPLTRYVPSSKISLTLPNLSRYEADVADPGSVYKDPALRTSYLKMYGNICFDTRENFVNFPWSSERK